MGCESSLDNMPPEVKIDDLKANIIEMIRKNPLYSISYSKFLNIIEENDYDEEDNLEIKENPEEFKKETHLLLKHKIDLLIEKLKINQIKISIIKDVLHFACDKLIYAYSTRVPSIFVKNLLLTFFFFCSRRKVDEDRRLFIIKLLKSTLKNNNTNEYNTGKFSFLIHNLINFCLFTFVYLFASSAIIMQNTSSEQNDLVDIYVNKKNTKEIDIKTLNDFILTKLTELNKRTSPSNLISRLLTKCLQPISRIIIDNPKSQFAIIEEEYFTEVVEILKMYLNAKLFKEIFFE